MFPVDCDTQNDVFRAENQKSQGISGAYLKISKKKNLQWAHGSTSCLVQRLMCRWFAQLQMADRNGIRLRLHHQLAMENI